MKSNKPYYFGAGPAALPESVLKTLQQAVLNVDGTQLSILELNHHSPHFQGFMEQLEALLRQCLAIPKHYHVLFMANPVRAHFGLIPLHFLTPAQCAAYWVSGYWSEMAAQEAKRFGQVQTLTPSDQCLKSYTYAYFTANETLTGFRFYPVVKPACPMIVDMTSCLLTEPIYITDYALIVAGVQKNLAHAGMTVLIIADLFLEQVQSNLIPTYLDYRVYAKHHSMCVTPPTFHCYVMLKMLEWFQASGDHAFFYAQNQKKARLLYDYIDKSDIYKNHIPPVHRSLVNITFDIQPPYSTADFIQGAKTHGLLGLEGHRTQGGIRVSLYNAVPIEGVYHLLQYMDDFSST